MAETPRSVEVDLTTAPIPVAVVRPAKSGEEVAALFFLGLLTTPLIAYVLMLIVGRVTDWDLSYWDTLLVLLAIRMVQVVPRSTSWTHKPKGSKL